VRHAADPELLILTSLASGPRHGYALIQDVEDFAAVRLGPGTLYGALGRLEDRGLIEALEPGDRRRPYRLTAAGARLLDGRVRDAQRILDVAATRLATD
jgi:DNA-binding PadR family transcriptional regulator